jgi:hypothetical protein
LAPDPEGDAIRTASTADDYPRPWSVKSDQVASPLRLIVVFQQLGQSDPIDSWAGSRPIHTFDIEKTTDRFCKRDALIVVAFGVRPQDPDFRVKPTDIRRPLYRRIGIERRPGCVLALENRFVSHVLLDPGPL